MGLACWRSVALGLSAIALVTSVAACSGAPQLSRDAAGTHATVGLLSFQIPSFLNRFTAAVPVKTSGQTTTQTQVAGQTTTHTYSEGCPIALPQ